MNFALAKSRSSKSAFVVPRGFSTRSRAPAISNHSYPLPTIARCACGGSCPRCTASAISESSLPMNAPDDKYEREADRVAKQVMRMSDPHSPPVSQQMPNGARSHIQRKCSCASSHFGETCPQCAIEKNPKLKSVNTEGRTSAHAPQTVHDVLNSSGEPLDAGSRSFMEPRFGQDFGGVRVHHDLSAAAVAASINARAFTVGRHIGFGSGEYAPNTISGRSLLSHELAHVVQQNDSSPKVARKTPSRSHPSPRVPAPEAPTAPATDTGSAHRCGPDVSSQVRAAVANVVSTWASWDATERDAQCDALDSRQLAGVAWDISDLHNQDWILGYQPTCATAGANPPCHNSVEVDGHCYYAGSANYVIFGTMCKLCDGHLGWKWHTPALSFLRGFPESYMQRLINLYKGPLPFRAASANWVPSFQWATAGYRGWPSAGTPPPGDRPGCAIGCPIPYGGSAFVVHWWPHDPF